MFFVYILKCADGSYYTGHTDALEERVAAHQNGSFGGYTLERLPVDLVFVQDFPTRDEAFNAERQIKGWSRRKKEAMINKDWHKLKEYASRAKKDPSRPVYAKKLRRARASSSGLPAIAPKERRLG